MPVPTIWGQRRTALLPPRDRLAGFVLSNAARDCCVCSSRASLRRGDGLAMAISPLGILWDIMPSLRPKSS